MMMRITFSPVTSAYHYSPFLAASYLRSEEGSGLWGLWRRWYRPPWRWTLTGTRATFAVTLRTRSRRACSGVRADWPAGSRSWALTAASRRRRRGATWPDRGASETSRPACWHGRSWWGWDWCVVLRRRSAATGSRPRRGRCPSWRCLTSSRTGHGAWSVDQRRSVPSQPSPLQRPATGS